VNGVHPSRRKKKGGGKGKKKRGKREKIRKPSPSFPSTRYVHSLGAGEKGKKEEGGRGASPVALPSAWFSSLTPFPCKKGGGRGKKKKRGEGVCRESRRVIANFSDPPDPMIWEKGKEEREGKERGDVA